MSGDGLIVILLVVLGIIYAVICMYEEKVDSDFDEIIESRCKKCVNYNTCSRHGRDYMCDCYYDKEKGVKRNE